LAVIGDITLRGHCFRNEIPPGAAMIALRDLVRAQEIHLWKEDRRIHGDGVSPRAGRETDKRLHEVWIQPRWRSTDFH
jgi:hypothetical protein